MSPVFCLSHVETTPSVLEVEESASKDRPFGEASSCRAEAAASVKDRIANQVDPLRAHPSLLPDSTR